MIGHVDLTMLAGPEAEMWQELLLLSERYRTSWCVVGAQMVTLHTSVHGVARPLRTRDVDVLVDVRAISTREVSEFFADRGFDLAGLSRDGVGHRFTRHPIVVDVLSIDNVGERADLTTLPPAHTIEVPGGRQAIEHLDEVSVSIEAASGTIPIPDWVGALVLKSRAAISIKAHRAKHLQDVALLLCLPVDLGSLAASLNRNERRYINRATEMLDESIWRAVAGFVDEREGKAAGAFMRSAGPRTSG